jgi:hypothetical protein
MSYDLLPQKTLFFYFNIRKIDILVIWCKLHKYLDHVVNHQPFKAHP